MRKSIGTKRAVYVQKYKKPILLCKFLFQGRKSTCITSFLILQEDMIYPHPLVQDLLWDTLHNFVEPFLTSWPLKRLVREKALRVAMEHIHYEDENSHYITIGCVEKVRH